MSSTTATAASVSTPSSASSASNSSDTDAILHRASSAFCEKDGTGISAASERENPYDFGESAMENVRVGLESISMKYVPNFAVGHVYQPLLFMFIPPAASLSCSAVPLTIANCAAAATRSQIFIGISGLIGAGKTTLATALGKQLGLPAYFEPVISNDYLADFYKDMKKHSFALQVPCRHFVSFLTDLARALIPFSLNLPDCPCVMHCAIIPVCALGSHHTLFDTSRIVSLHSLTQVHLLNLRFKQQQVIIWQGRGGVQVCSDI